MPNSKIDKKFNDSGEKINTNSSIDINELTEEIKQNIKTIQSDVDKNKETNTDFLLRIGCSKEITSVVDYIVKSQVAGESLDNIIGYLKDVGWTEGDINKAVGVVKDYTKVLFSS